MQPDDKPETPPTPPRPLSLSAQVARMEGEHQVMKSALIAAAARLDGSAFFLDMTNPEMAAENRQLAANIHRLLSRIQGEE